MNTETDLTSQLELIADVLANSHDWDATDLQFEVSEAIKKNDPGIDKSFADFISKNFYQIPIEARIQKDFDHLRFVMDGFVRYKSN